MDADFKRRLVRHLEDHIRALKLRLMNMNAEPAVVVRDHIVKTIADAEDILRRLNDADHAGQ